MPPDVPEFVILTPGACHTALLYSRERLRAYLAAMFPSYRFSLARMAGGGTEDEFIVVPVVAEAEEGGDAPAGVSEAILIEIRAALEAFEVYGAGCRQDDPPRH